LLPLLVSTQQSGVDVSISLETFSEKVWTLKQYGRETKNKLSPTLLVLRIMGVVVLPAIFSLSAFFFEEFVLGWYTQVFIYFVAFLVAMLNMVVYDEAIESMILVPLFISGSFLVPFVLQNLINVF